jgi:hypothetical protein
VPAEPEGLCPVCPEFGIPLLVFSPAPGVAHALSAILRAFHPVLREKFVLGTDIAREQRPVFFEE